MLGDNMGIWDFLLGLVKGLFIFAVIILIIWIVIAIFLYIITSALMEKHSKLKYGKSSLLVWIPIARLYYLGKEIHSELLGYGLVIFDILFKIDGFAGTKILFFSGGTVFKLVVYAMFIHLYTKYKELKLSTIKEAKIKKEK